MKKIVSQEQQDKKKKKTIIGLSIFGGLILIGLLILLIMLLSMRNKQIDNTDGDDSPSGEVFDSENIYNRLLEVVNIEATNNSYPVATDLISFDYQSTYFYITASNDSKVYNYSINMKSIDCASIDQAIEYLKDNNPSNAMAKVFDQSNVVTTPDSYINKYITSDVKYKCIATEIGANTYITSTMYNIANNKISVIYKGELNTAIDNSYTPKEIDITTDAYQIYKYIACK